MARPLTETLLTIFILTTPHSQDTIERAKSAGAELLSSDLELVQQCSVILSVVPPRDAEATAQRVADALSGGSSSSSVYFLELNAVAPSTSREIAHMFEKARVPVQFIDGCIIGGPPQLKNDRAAVASEIDSNSSDLDWIRPNIPISGPHDLLSIPQGERLSAALNLKVISKEIGAASGLKMCFAAMAKGFTAIATQSFATAHSLGVVDELKQQLMDIMPANLTAAQRRVPSMPPKAYRWVREMEEISKTMSEEGGWDATLFQGAAGVYKAVAEDAVLGKEKVGKRSRGTSVDDVATLMAEGLERKRKKME